MGRPVPGAAISVGGTEIGVGLPAAVAGVGAGQILDWARQADAAGFSSLATLDRLVYGNLESLVTLSAAAAVTERIRLAPTVLLAPYRGNPVLLAKQLATLDLLSAGRLVVGLAAGGRPDDFTAAGTRYPGRGRTLDAMVEQMLDVWAGKPVGEVGAVGPAPPSGAVPMVFGGHTDMAIRRAARYGEGWVCGGSSASGYPKLAEHARSLWSASGRSAAPRLVALCYFALGADAREHARAYVADYYGFLGASATSRIGESVLTDGARVRETAAAYAAAGCDELIFVPCLADPGQLDLLGAALT